MTPDSIDELLAWAKENGQDFGWWKTARTVDDRLVLALPPHDSLYIVEMFRTAGGWVVRHGDSTEAPSLLVRQLPAHDEPVTLLEKLCRSLIADASTLLNSNPDWALALGECVVAIAGPLELGYLKVAGSEMLTRASEAIEPTPPPLAVAPSAGVPIPPAYSPAPRVPPQAPLRNQYFNEPTKAPRGPMVSASARSKAAQSGRGNGLAIASISLGIVGYLLLYTWFSVVIALAAIGTGLAVIVGGRPGRVLAWVGLSLGGLCLLVAVAVLLGAR